MKRWLLVVGVFVGSGILTLTFLLPFLFFIGYESFFSVVEDDNSEDYFYNSNIEKNDEMCSKYVPNRCLSFEDGLIEHGSIEDYVYEEYGEEIDILDILDVNTIERPFNESSFYEYALFKVKYPIDEYKVGAMELWRNDIGYYIRDIILFSDDVATFNVFYNNDNSSVVTIYNVNHKEFINYEIYSKTTDYDFKNGYKMQVEIVPNEALEDYIEYISDPEYDVDFNFNFKGADGHIL